MLNLHAKPYYLNNNQIKIIEKMVANMSQAAKIGQLFL